MDPQRSEPRAPGPAEAPQTGQPAGSPPPPWTPEQWEAITRTGSNLLVSAAAGSGKTAVLVERIIRKLVAEDHPVDIDRLLVVTFTEAAATQMRQRIAQALEARLAADPGNERLRRQLMLVPKASISTLHAFCRWVLQQYFFQVDLDPRFRVADEHEALLLQHDALDHVLARAYAAAEPAGAFSRLAAACAGPAGDEPLRDLAIRLYAQARSLPDPRGWLQQLGQPPAPAAGLAEEDIAALIDQAPWSPDLRRWARARTDAAYQWIAQALSLANGPGGVPAYQPVLEDLLAQIDGLRQACQLPWRAMRQAFADLSIPRLPQDRKGEGDGDVRGAIQALRRQARELLLETRDILSTPAAADHWETVERNAPIVAALVDLTLQLDEEYRRLKAARGLVDFADLEHLCLQVLQEPGAASPGAEGDGAPQGPALRPSAVARELQERFTEVLVDEYQDTNPVQDAILRLVSRQPRGRGDGGQRPNLFLVGDVKQSIYRFRLADPGLFIERAARSRPVGPGAPPATPPPDDASVHLSANFRSRRNIVDGVNYIFRQILVPEVGEIAYDRAAELVYKAPYPAGGDPPLEVHLLDTQKDPGIPPGGDGSEGGGGGWGDAAEDLTTFQREAVVVAHRLRQLLGLDPAEAAPDPPGPAQVWDPSLGQYRPARFSDVAILLRAVKDKANALVEILGKYGIPAYAELGTGYFAATEVETMLSLLAIIDNPRQDIPLAAVLRSPMVGLTPAELAQIRLHLQGAGGKEGEEGDFFDAVLAAAQQLPAGEGGNGLAARLRAFLQQLDQWRTAARRGPLSHLLRDIYQKTRYDDYVAALPGGRQRRANLRALYERARQFDRFDRQGLSRFLLFIRRLRQSEGDLGTAPAVSEDENAVRVMSVHQSKGLEFPIVVLMDVGRAFQRPRPAARLFLFQRDLGIGMMGLDEDQRLIYPSLPYLAVEERIRREERAEEMRILYVALTRARERLVVTGSATDLPARCAAWIEASRRPPGQPLPPETLGVAESWLDWLGPALCRHPQAAPLRAAAWNPRDVEPIPDPSRWHFRLWSPPEVAALPGPATAADGPLLPGGPDAAPATPAPPLEELAPALHRRLTWEYPWRVLTEKAAKLRASELKRRWDGEGEADGETVPLHPAPRFSPGRRSRQAPRETSLSPMEQGSAVHLVLQLLDLHGDLDEEGIKGQVERLRRQGRLTDAQAQAIDPRPLAWFFASPLGRRVRAEAGRVMREVAFTLALPVAEVYGSVPGHLAEDEYVLTQGIMDLLLPSDDGILLVDFKTDRIAPGTGREAAARYRTQMALYRRAVREIYGQPVREAYIVFLTAGETVAL